MARSLQNKLDALDPARRVRIEAEAERLHAEYLSLQQSPRQQNEVRDDTDSEHR